MDAFEFSNVRRIVFGPGTIERIGEIVSGSGDRCLLVSNAGDPGQGGTVDLVYEQLTRARVAVAVYRQRGEPTVDSVQKALERAREYSTDVIVGLGGGSAIDAAKAVAGLLANGGGPLDYMEVIGSGQPLRRSAIPWVAIPTTAGTGAEVTRNAVLGCPEKRFKASLRSEKLLAHAVVVDPQLGKDVSPEVTARSGLDALCQLIESYTSRRANPVSDALAGCGIPRAAAALPRAYRNGGDREAREQMALAALLSGITLTNVGLGAVHGFAAPMGAHYPIPHGTVCGLLLPHVFQANAAALQRESEDHPQLRRFVAVARWLTGAEDAAGPEAIAAGAAWLSELVRELQLPSLREFAIQRSDFATLIPLAQRASSMRYNPVALDDATLGEILEHAW